MGNGLVDLSLTISYITWGVFPNVGSVPHLFKSGSKTAGEVGQQVARHGDEAADATRQLCNGDYCFPAGTLVATEAGSKPIETVEVGERVWSLDMTTEQWELRSIRRRSRLEYEGRIIRLQIAGETVESTEHHPFWVVSGNNLEDRPRPKHAAPREVDTSLPGRWVDAVHLEHYDTLQLMSGLHVVITSIETRTANELVYNFDVEDHHCYAVGNQAVLVHNNIDDCLKSLEGAAPKGTFDDALRVRDEKLAEIAQLSNTQKKKVSTVVGGVHVETGQTAVGIKRSGENYGKCAEDLCLEQLGNDASKVLLSPAIRPRSNDIIPVCKRCQTKFTSGNFPPGTRFEE